MTDPTVIGYGSLMSGFGMLPFGRLRVRAAARVALVNARRGFGKFSQYGDRFAMVLEPVRADVPIEARTLPVDAPPTAAIEGLAMTVASPDLYALSDREGYRSDTLRRLCQEAAAHGHDLGAYLWSLLAAAGFAIPRYRARLFGLLGYTSPHYLPHPVRLDATRFALTFLAPGAEGTGAPSVIPVRVRTGHLSLMTAAEAWRRKPNRTQLAYFAACLLGGVHGIDVSDLLAPLVEDLGACAPARTFLRTEAPEEIPRFLHMTGLDAAAYSRSLGSPPRALRRSGLGQFIGAFDPHAAHAGVV